MFYSCFLLRASCLKSKALQSALQSNALLMLLKQFLDVPTKLITKMCPSWKSRHQFSAAHANRERAAPANKECAAHANKGRALLLGELKIMNLFQRVKISKRQDETSNPQKRVFSLIHDTSGGLNSESWFPRITPLCVTKALYIWAQWGSCLFIQSHRLLLSAASDAALMAELGPLIPRPLSNLTAGVAMKPLHLHRADCGVPAAMLCFNTA